MAKEKVEVVAYSAYCGEEMPGAFKWREKKAEVDKIVRRWTEKIVSSLYLLISIHGVHFSLPSTLSR